MEADPGVGGAELAKKPFPIASNQPLDKIRNDHLRVSWEEMVAEASDVEFTLDTL